MEHDTATRHGMEMDLASACLIGALNEQFDNLDDWVIDDRSSMIKSENRSVTIECVNPRVIDGTITSGVFDAFCAAGLQVNSTLWLDGDRVRIWYDEVNPPEPNGVLVD